MQYVQRSFALLSVVASFLMAQIPQPKVEVQDFQAVHTPESAFIFHNSPSISVRINAHSDKIQPYEPIFLEIEALDTKTCGACRFVNLSTGDLRLVIDAGKGQKQFYRPALKTCWFGQVQPEVRKSHETVILSAGNIVTRNPGNLRLFLCDGANNIVSNLLEIVVRPSSKREKIWAEEASRYPAEYGMFLYLGGGDHLANGRRIVERMSKSGTAYAPWARSIMACNHSQNYTDWKSMKIVRKADLYLAMNELPQEGVPPGILDQIKNNIQSVAQSGGASRDVSEKALRDIEGRVKAYHR